MYKFNFNRSALKAVLKERKITYSMLVDILEERGVPIAEATIKSWFNKVQATPDIDKILAIAQILNIRADELIDQNVFETIDNIKGVPIIGEASCGLPISSSYQDNEFTYMPEGEYKKELYAVRASGDSMSPLIDDGDIVICDPTIELQNGDLVYYTLYQTDIAIKVFVENKERELIQFKPVNSTADFKTVTILLDDADMINNLKITKVVKIVKDTNNGRRQNLKLVGVE
ncbi:MAG: helix-turn-helix domain-containing protein [Campylobacter sp.]|nr:helix-turn-helix domain-containing protein [Campylobacter sp.]